MENRDKNNFYRAIEYNSSINAKQILTRNLSSNDAFDNQEPTLLEITQLHSEIEALEFLILWINYVIDMAKVKNNPQKKEKELISAYILKHFPNLKLSEIALVFLKIPTGEYGNYYQTLNLYFFINAFKSYERQEKETKRPKQREFSLPTNMRASSIILGLIENNGFKSRVDA